MFSDRLFGRLTDVVESSHLLSIVASSLRVNKYKASVFLFAFQWFHPDVLKNVYSRGRDKD